jgi:hypothetical protein
MRHTVATTTEVADWFQRSSNLIGVGIGWRRSYTDRPPHEEAAMASLKNLTATFSTAVGPRRYILPSLAIAIGTLLDVGMLKFGIFLDADGPFAYLPFVAGISIAAIMIIWWLLDYATKIRADMGAITNMEQALDALSADFDETRRFSMVW